MPSAFLGDRLIYCVRVHFCYQNRLRSLGGQDGHGDSLRLTSNQQIIDMADIPLVLHQEVESFSYRSKHPAVRKIVVGLGREASQL